MQTLSVVGMPYISSKSRFGQSKDAAEYGVSQIANERACSEQRSVNMLWRVPSFVLIGAWMIPGRSRCDDLFLPKRSLPYYTSQKRILTPPCAHGERGPTPKQNGNYRDMVKRGAKLKGTKGRQRVLKNSRDALTRNTT